MLNDVREDALNFAECKWRVFSRHVLKMIKERLFSKSAKQE